MFTSACRVLHDRIYGIMGLSKTGPRAVSATTGTGFMVAPGVIATVAHLCHVENNPKKPLHARFDVIRAPDIGMPMEHAQLIAEDAGLDIALLRMTKPRSRLCVALEPRAIPMGTNCGSLGFPLAAADITTAGARFNLIERFQSASVSALQRQVLSPSRSVIRYETDSLMYGGSSGCPGFLADARVFAMHFASIVDKKRGGSGAAPGSRLAISLWISAEEIRRFAARPAGRLG